MKLTVVGFGRGGSRIADEFARWNKKARRSRGLDIVTDTFAVDTDVENLAALGDIGFDYRHRVLIGGGKTGGHGLDKISELGAELAWEAREDIVDAIRANKQLFESDAFLLVAATAGGTGSGAISAITPYLKERYPKMAVYVMAVLPFRHEEVSEERVIFNSAVCLKSVYEAADAVFLVDNDKLTHRAPALRAEPAKINEHIVAPFYNLLGVGEEKKARYIGARMLDAGDIMQVLSGWTAIGCAFSPLPRFGFRHSREAHQGLRLMDEAISELSVSCHTRDAARALYLISAPARGISMEMVTELGDYLKQITRQAVIRDGDYPRETDRKEIVLVLSQLGDVERVRELYRALSRK
jgi:cell division GTPase FtsZ